MSVTLFPIAQPVITMVDGGLPLYREVGWDYSKNIPVISRGNPIWTEGKEAVLVWAWKALQVPRYRKEIYTWAYGCELDELIGRPYSEETKKAEVNRYIREALLINPYITRIEDVQMESTNDRLTIRVKISTTYGDGEVKLSV